MICGRPRLTARDHPTGPLTQAHLYDFVSCYRADDQEIFWLRDKRLEDQEDVPPDVSAEEIMEDLRAALVEIVGDIWAARAKMTKEGRSPFRRR